VVRTAHGSVPAGKGMEWPCSCACLWEHDEGVCVSLKAGGDEFMGGQRGQRGQNMHDMKDAQVALDLQS